MPYLEGGATTGPTQDLFFDFNPTTGEAVVVGVSGSSEITLVNYWASFIIYYNVDGTKKWAKTIASSTPFA